MQRLSNAGSRTLAALLATLSLGGCTLTDDTDGTDGTDGTEELSTNEQQIQGGSIEDNANFPWIVHVQGVAGCHGTLIQPRWVLTAAHCVYQRYSGVTVSYSRTNPKTGVVTSGTQTTPPETQYGHYVFVHPSYTLSQWAYDIALIKLPAPFPDDPLLQPADLPLTRPNLGAAAEVASSQINEGNNTPPPAGKVAVMRGSVAANVCQATPDQICISSPTATNICGGDSGSGVISRVNGLNYVTGVAVTTRIQSPLDECGSYDDFAATDVIQYLDWIAGVVGAPAQNANFTPKTQLYWSALDFGLPSTWESIAGDFNGDGKTDYARVGSTGAWLYFGSASGTFTQGFLDYSDLSFGQPSTWTTIVGNFERTGNASCPTCMDFVRLGATGMWMFYGNSNGTFTRRFQAYTGLNFGQPTNWQTVVGDFDGDGRTDYGRLGATGAWMYYGNTNRTFTQTFYAYQSGFDFGWGDTHALATGDFNGDGRTDYSRLGGTVGYTYYGTAGRSFTTGTYGYPGGNNFGQPSTWETVNGNFNGDSRADYARVGATGAWIYYSTGTGFTQQFYSFGGYNFGQPSSYKTIAGDFSGDGKTDFGRLGDTGAFFYFGTATQGTFTTLFQEYQRHYGLPSSFSTLVGNFNGDSRADYVRLGGVFEDTFIHN